MTLGKHIESNQGNGPGLAGICQIGFQHYNIASGVEPGVFCFDPFDRFETMVAADTKQNGYAALIDTGCTIDLINEVGGVIEFDMAADNDDVCLFTGQGVHGFCAIPASDEARYDFFAEARVKAIDESALELFFGLTSSKATSVIAATDNTLASTDYIGFHKKTTGLDVVMNDAAETRVAQTNPFADDTWVKLSLRFTKIHSTSGQLEFCINGGEPVLRYMDLTNSTNGGVPTSIKDDGSPMVLALCARANGAATELEIDHLAWGSKAINS